MLAFPGGKRNALTTTATCLILCLCFVLLVLLQLLFLVRRFDESNAFMCEEWCD